jgi:hypothetical protein
MEFWLIAGSRGIIGLGQNGQHGVSDEPPSPRRSRVAPTGPLLLLGMDRRATRPRTLRLRRKARPITPAAQ